MDVRGAIDAAGRCPHHHAAWDVVALRLACCPDWWGCHACHDHAADHPARPVSADTVVAVAACGACGAAYAPAAYLAVYRDHPDAPACPTCGHAWNPGCADHLNHYVEGAGSMPS